MVSPGGGAMAVPLWWWVAFHAVAGALLALDIRTSRRQAAGAARGGWVRMALAWMAVAGVLFCLLWAAAGRGIASQFGAGYLLEQSLSIDNLFLFVVIFRAFAVPAEAQHRVLVWGVAGAVAMRAALLAGGLALLQRFAAVEVVFGAVVLASGVYLLFAPRGGDREMPRWLAWVQSREGRLRATPLLAALVAVEITDLVFALDSIPAVLSVSRNYFVVYTSNVLAVLSLRAVFPGVVEALRRFRYLPVGIAVVLCFAGMKMLAARWVAVSPEVSLAGIVMVLGVAVAASRWRSTGVKAGR